MIIDIVKVIIPTVATFIIGIAIAPILTHYLYKYKVWKKSPGKLSLDGTEATEFNKLHAEKELKTPRMGGILIWSSAIITILLIWAISQVFPGAVTEKLDFLSRNQTWIPFFTLIIGSFVGLLNDFFDVTHAEGKGLKLGHRLMVVGAVSLFVGWWFYQKLDVTSLGIPFGGELEIGWLIIPFFILVTMALYASGVIDGIDGLSGGIFATIFTAYAGIAFYQQQIDLAAFSGAIAGGTLAFLWFNIPPARFYMTETGTMGLTITLAVVAFMTDSLGGGIGISVLPIVALPLVITVLSNIIQVLSKKLRGKKIFKIAPIHHHFEAIGWPSYKVTMRYWIFGVISAMFGVILALVG